MDNFSLPIARYNFIFEAKTTIQFPPYAGSTWRGALGHALRRIICMTGQSHCHQCLLQYTCPYIFIFETQAHTASLLGKVETAPHPYILQPLPSSGRSYKPTARFNLELTLLGTAITYLPYFIQALQQVGQQGIGKNNGQFNIVAVTQAPKLDTEHRNWQVIINPLKL